ncbi:MAG: helix-turn-helix transcriptional regulator [Lachnospiraceae bacterium]|nr:helix-turn-helix transcriptional regulator [Lachnospiraceae bacterium]
MLVEKILEFCKKQEISISSLEKRSGIANGTISRWNKSSPTLSSLQKIANVLGIKVSDLLNENVIE